jgi:HEAT repeats
MKASTKLRWIFLFAATQILFVNLVSGTQQQTTVPSPDKPAAQASPQNLGTVPSPTPNKPSAKVALDFAQVPEVLFEAAAFREPINPAEAKSRITDAVNKANRLNQKTRDGFVEDLCKHRQDLQGLPFVMGDDCRMAEDRLGPFTAAAESAHEAVALLTQSNGKHLPNAATVLPAAFQRGYCKAATKEEPIPDSSNFAAQMVLPNYLILGLHFRQAGEIKKSGPEYAKKPIACAQAAALMQVLAPEPPELRMGLISYLARMQLAEATRALANLAIFSEEREVREAACRALESRNKDDYIDVLARGLNYPWPAVAQRASEAIAQLDRSELIPQLISVLEQPDPRAPQTKEVDGKKVFQMRELVRINHHRSCLLCHPPGNTAAVSKEVIKGTIPVPGEPLPSFRSYLDPPSHPDHVVRVDVTYLRQDFSQNLPVANAAPWPAKQRFDFLVRTRNLTEPEAQAYRELFQPREPGALSPYQRAAQSALQELTGRDAEPTAAAWRKLLGVQ